MTNPRPTILIRQCPVCGQDEVGRWMGPTGRHYLTGVRRACDGEPVAVEYVLAAEATVPELLGFAETAEVLGVSTSNLRSVAGLPEPVVRLRSGPVWRASDIREFARRDNGARPETQWTKAAVRAAIRLFEERYSRIPTSLDFNPADARAKGHPGRAERFAADGDYPHVATVQKVYGSWSAALEAAVK